jgi:uncharacterized protein
MMVTALYASLLAVIFVGMSLHVIRNRWRAGKSLGDGGDKGLRAAIRAHGNFAEYVPFSLVMMGLVEGGGGPDALVHGLGIAVVLSRALHAWGLMGHRGPNKARSIGMTLTFGVLLVAAGALLRQLALS